MSVICTFFVALACVGLLGGGYVCVARWAETPILVKVGLAVLVAVCILAAYCFHRPLLFGGHDCFHRWLSGFAGGGASWPAVLEESDYQQAQGRVLGDYIRKHVTGGVCVILTAPALTTIHGKVLTDHVVEGLCQSLDGAFERLVLAEVPMGMAQQDSDTDEVESKKLKTGLRQSAWTVSALTTLLDPVGRADVLVACFPLPEECFGASGEVTAECLRGKKLFLAAGAWGNALKAVRGGGVLAAVVHQDEPRKADRCPASYEEAFSRRYALFVRDGAVNMPSGMELKQGVEE